MHSPDELLQEITAARLTRGDILAKLKLSDDVLEKLIEGLGPRVLWLGQGDSAWLIPRRPVRDVYLSFPIYYIDKHGQDRLNATLHPILPAGFLLELHESSPWPVGEGGRLSLEGLPYYLSSLAPEGFLGKAFASAYGTHLGVPISPSDWSDEDILYALSRRGLDLPGNLVIGEVALTRVQQSLANMKPVPQELVGDAYTSLADWQRNSLAQGKHFAPNALLGGAQPKFTAFRESDTGGVHVVVKYALRTGTPADTRWSDLLVCEHLALLMAQEKLGLEVASSRIVQTGRYTFLELERFDRLGSAGRLPVCTWASINQGIVGAEPGPWPTALRELYSQGMLEASALSRVLSLWMFGKLICNTDMHEGNIALMPSHQGFRLAPVYDMLPMHYAPVNGVVPADRTYVPPTVTKGAEGHWPKVMQAAGWFWVSAARDTRITESFRRVCADNVGALKQLMS